MRILSFIAVVLLGFVGPWWLLVPAACIFAFRYPAYELLVLGFVLDLSYGAGADPIPVYYTLGALALIALMAVAKPRLTFATHASF